MGRIDSGSCETFKCKWRCETSSCQGRDVIEAMGRNHLTQHGGLNPGSYSWTALLLDEPQGSMPSRLRLHYFTCLPSVACAQCHMQEPQSEEIWFHSQLVPVLGWSNNPRALKGRSNSPFQPKDNQDPSQVVKQKVLLLPSENGHPSFAHTPRCPSEVSQRLQWSLASEQSLEGMFHSSQVWCAFY